MVRPIETIEKELREYRVSIEECHEEPSEAKPSVVTTAANKVAAMTLAATISTFVVAPPAHASGLLAQDVAALEEDAPDEAIPEAASNTDAAVATHESSDGMAGGSLSDTENPDDASYDVVASSPFDAARIASAYEGLPTPIINEDVQLSPMGFVAMAKQCYVTCNYGLDQSQYATNKVFKIYTEGDPIEFPTPEKAMEVVNASEWKFIGWFTAPTGGTMVADANSKVVGSLLASKSDIDYYAQYEYIGTYDITFRYEFAPGIGNGATVPADTVVKVNVNNAIGNAVPTPPAAPAGAKFGGWYDSDGKVVDPKRYVVRGDATFIGRYIDDSTVMHSVTFVWGKEGIGDGIHTDQPVEFEENTAVAFPTASDISIGTTYGLVGWYTQPNGAGVMVADANGKPVAGTIAASLTGNATFYAHYKYTGTYTVQFKFMLDSSAQAAAPSGTKAPATQTRKITAEKLIGTSLPAETSISGCMFKGWYVADASGNPTGDPRTSEQMRNTAVEGNVTYVGVYTAIPKTTYSVTFNWGRYYAPDSGALATDKHSSSITVEEGKTIASAGGAPSDSQVAVSGYTFLGWYDSANKLMNANAAVTAAGTYTAKYEKTPCYDVYFHWGAAYIDGEGADPTDQKFVMKSVEKGSTLASVLPSNTQVAVSGYKFLGWYDAAGNKLNANAPVQAGQVYTARYERVETPVGPVDPTPGPVNPVDPTPVVPVNPTPQPGGNTGTVTPIGQSVGTNPRNPFTPWNPPGLAVAAGFTVPAAGPGVDVFEELPEPVVTGAGAGGDDPYDEDSLPAEVSLFDAEEMSNSALPFSSVELVTTAALAGGVAAAALIASKASAFFAVNAQVAANMRPRRIGKGKKGFDTARRKRRKALGLA